jgi:hypothetical protein
MKRLPRATPQQMLEWVRDLDSNQFAIRRIGSEKLEQFGHNHEALLRKAFEDAGSLEVRQRLQIILQRVYSQLPLRNRMLEVLERIGTDQARHFLLALASQTEDVGLAQEAAASLKRITRS